MTPARLAQLLLTADALETDARAMRSGAWQRSMIAGAAAIRELVGAIPAHLDAARERDTLREQNTRLAEAATALLATLDRHEDASGAGYHEPEADAVYGAKNDLRDALRPKDPANV